MIPRIDFIFSYWILFWYILYISKIIHCCSPLFAILLGLVENLFLLIYISLNGASISTILKFIVIVIVMKGIPYYTLRNEKITINDIILTMLLFLVYLFWLFINKINFIQIYQKVNNSLIKNKGDTPGIMLIDYILKMFL